jgi:hypothetical protein
MVGATVRMEHFAFTKGEPRAYDSSPKFVRLSCAGCGSALGMQAKKAPKLMDFNLGSLDDPSSIKPEFHQFTSDQVRWYDIADDLPRHAKTAPVLTKIWSEFADA